MLVFLDHGTSDIFESNAEALVNPVNLEGVSGAGLALAFKERYPPAAALYRNACLEAKLTLGEIFVVTTEFLDRPKWIVHVPTKRRWDDLSQLSHILIGLKVLSQWADTVNPDGIALPKLGCGLGKLQWNDVKPLYREHLNPRHDWYIF